MSRGVFNLDKDGGLKISEDQVIGAALLLVTLHGYEPNRTESNTVTRGKTPHGILRKGTLDYVMTHGYRPAFYCEFKRRRSGTEKNRRLAQRETAERLRRAGFKVFLADENDPAPIETFTQWFMDMVDSKYWLH